MCFVLTARGAKIFGPRIGESIGLAGGEDGALIVLESETEVLAVLDTEETDWWRGTCDRLERLGGRLVRYGHGCGGEYVQPVSRDVGDGGSECGWKNDLLGPSVDSEKVLRKGDVVGCAS